MHTPRLLRCAGAVTALAIVSACAGGSAVAPPAPGLNASYVGRTLFVNGRPTTAERRNPLPSYSNLVPLKKKKSKDYEYIFNSYQTYASVFNYPKSTSMIGKVNGLGGQGCTNVLYGYGKKIVWNAGRNGTGSNYLITEYQVPSNKVIRSLTLSYEYTSSCAMDTSGDLAVGVLCSNYYCGPAGQVVIYSKATGKPTVYNTPLDREYFDGYDSSGNLFADGEDSYYGFMLVELPKGSSKFVTIKTSNSPSFPGSVQWDGTYLTVFDQDTSETYQYTVSGTTATLKNTVKYSDASDCAQTWLVKSLMYCGDYGNNYGSVYNYPAGGTPVATFSGEFDGPLGVTAAKK
jgi:hypothetical protein